MRQGLADAVDVIDGLHAFGYLPDSIDPPVFAAGEVQINWDQVEEGGWDEFVVTCHLYTSTADDRSGQKLLDRYLARNGDDSIKQALEADKTLGGACQTLHVQRATGYGKYRIASLEQPEVRYYGARLNVRVWGS